jgi:hypothetical protein
MARTAGIDWASEAHEVCVVDGGEVIRRKEIAHEEAGISFLCQIAELTRRIRVALAEHPDAEIFAPLFRDPKTVVCPATLIAELGDVRERYPTDGGMSPVAVESGKRSVAVFRRACDKRLRVALATLASSTRHWHPWAEDVYRRARERGQDHSEAIRTLGRAWVRVLWRCWVDRVPYDPTKHGNLQRLETARS